MVKEKKLLQETTLYDLDLWVNVKQNVVQCPLNHMTFVHAKFEVATSNSLEGDAFLLHESTLFDLLSTLYITYPIHLQALRLLVVQPLRSRCIY